MSPNCQIVSKLGQKWGFSKFDGDLAHWLVLFLAENDETSCEQFVKEVEKIVKAIYAKVSLNGDTMVNPIASGSGINVIRALTPRSKNR